MDQSAFDLFFELITELQLVAPDRKRSRLIEFRESKIEMGVCPRLISMAIAIFDQGSASERSVHMTVEDNSISNVDVSGSGVAIGKGSKVETGGDFTVTIRSSSAPDAVKGLLLQVRELIDAATFESPALKTVSTEQFQKLAEEAVKPEPDKGVLSAYWSSFKSSASALMSLKPFIELGLFIAKVTGHA